MRNTAKSKIFATVSLLQLVLEQCEVQGRQRPRSRKFMYNFLFSQNLTIVVSQSLQGLVPGPLKDTQLFRCSSTLYKIMQNSAYSWPSTSVDSQPQIKNDVFNPQLVESIGAESREMEGSLYIYFKNLCKSEPAQFKPLLSKGQLYINSLIS